MTRRGMSMRAAVVVASVVVVGLVVAGVVLTATTQAGSVGRELGPALLSGGIVGGALVVVESLLAGAADARSEHEALVTLLSSTGELNGIDLAGRRLRGLYLPGRALVAARLEGTDLSGAKLYWGDMRACRLAGARLDGADLSGSTLAGADLTGASLRGTILIDADLRGVDLAGADLTDALIEGTVLTDARLVRADLSRAVIRTSLLMGGPARRRPKPRLRGHGPQSARHDDELADGAHAGRERGGPSRADIEHEPGDLSGPSR